MYQLKDQVFKLHDRAGNGSRFVAPGRRGEVVRVTPPPEGIDRHEFPYILVRFFGTLSENTTEEWVYFDDIVRADGWHMFEKENGRTPTINDVVGYDDDVALLEIYPEGSYSAVPPAPGEIVGDGPVPHFDDGYGYGNPGLDPPSLRDEYPGTFTPTLANVDGIVRIDDSTLRKMQPVGTVVTEYFPDALLGVSAVAWVGNEKHNPGERLHWARSKSSDQIDAEFRHAIDAARPGSDGWDTVELPDGRVYQIRHKAAKAWRALADAQLDIESANGQVIRRLK